MIVPQRIHTPEHAVIRTGKWLPADVRPGCRDMRRYGFGCRMARVIQGLMSRHTDSFT